MTLKISTHCRNRAKDRMAWTSTDIINYWYRHVGHYKDVFPQGDGVYNLVVGGIVFSCAADFTNNEVRLLTVNHEKPWSTTGYIGEIYDCDGNYISYGPKVKAAGPAVFREYPSNHGRHNGQNKNGIGRSKKHPTMKEVFSYLVEQDAS